MFDISDDSVFLIKNGKEITWKNFCESISSLIISLKNDSQHYFVVSEENFLEDFFAGIFAGKEIVLKASAMKEITEMPRPDNVINSNELDPKKIFINFSTSGSSGKSKLVRKSLYNLMCEAKDAMNEIVIPSDIPFFSTTKMNHMFGLTFFLMYPFLNGNPIVCDKIQFLEQVKSNDYVLISTPSFLDKLVKYDDFSNMPRTIFTAGAKLELNNFQKLENYSNIVEIYGSTESGIIAKKTHFSDPMKVFNNVKLSDIEDDFFEVESEYFLENKIRMNDRLKMLSANEFEILMRSDRVLKIQEKRIDAEFIEMKLNEIPFIKDCYCMKYNNKLACAVVLSKFSSDCNRIIPFLKNYLSKFSEIIPQKWRFIPEIPKNPMGKIDKLSIQKFFTSKLSFPVVYNTEIARDSAVLELCFNNSCNYFKGHFKSYPILPGVIQVHFAALFSSMLFNLEFSDKKIKKLKFSNVIIPEQPLHLKLVLNGTSAVNFTYSSPAGNIYSQGTLL